MAFRALSATPVKFLSINNQSDSRCEYVSNTIHEAGSEAKSKCSHPAQLGISGSATRCPALCCGCGARCMIGVLAARGTLRVPASCVRSYVIRRELAGAGLDWCVGILAPRRGGRRLLAWVDLNRDGHAAAAGPGERVPRVIDDTSHSPRPLESSWREPNCPGTTRLHLPCLTSRARPPALAGFATAAQWQATAGGHRRKG